MIRTVLFTDIVGSTALRATHGDSTVDALVHLHDEIVRSAVGAVDGIVVKGTGDGSLAVFDSAVAAVLAGVEIQRLICAWQEAPTEAGDLAVRVGINAGEVSETDTDVLGEAVNAAARVLDHTDGGEVVVTRVVRDLIGTTELAFVDRGDHALRGFPEVRQLFAVDWERLGEPRVLAFRLLGEATAEVAGERLAGGLAPGLQRLVAQLALAAGRPVARSSLAFTFWPDSDESQARTNLRKLLHQLRRDVPDISDHVEIDPRHLRWRSEGTGTIDVLEFESAIERGDDATAMAAYGGDLLPEVYDDWVLVERDRLRDAGCRALARLTTAAADRGDDQSVLDHAGAQVAIDGLAEDAYRAQICAHARMGNRAEALRTYHRCTQVLADELGVEPDAATRQTYAELMAGAVAPAVAAPARPTPLMVGRDRELAALLACWEQAASGRAHLVLISGEPGIGKSRLVQELQRRIGNVATVAMARSYEAAGGLPWGPVVEWLRFPRLMRRCSALGPAWRSELGVLLPELVEHAPSELTGAVLDPSRRRQLFDAIGTALLGDPGPLVLGVDDLQWCDADTIELIGFLLARHRSAPLLVVGTARDAEVGADHPLTALVNGLHRIDAVTEINLERLDAATTAELAASLSDAAVSDDALEQVWRETDGNPLFVIETARAGLGSGRSGPMPLTMRATISSRLGRLSPPAKAVLEAAAVVGRGFSAETLVEVMDEPDTVVVAALDELWRHQIIREQGAEYDFTHGKIREVAVDGLSPIHRRRLHAAVATAIVALDGDQPGPHSAHLATQLEAAGRPGPASDALHAAARHAAGVHAMEETERACRRGLALLEQLPAGQDRDERELALRLLLAPTVVTIEGYTSPVAREGFDRCIALCHRLGRSPDPATLRGLGLSAVASCQFDRSATQGRALVAMDDNIIAVTEGHYLLGVTAFWRGDMAGSRHHLEAALGHYSPEHGENHRVFFAQDPYGVCQARLGLTLIWSGDVAAGWEALDEALAHSASVGHPHTRVYVSIYAGLAAAEVGDLDRLRRCIEVNAHLWEHQTMATFSLIGRCFVPWLRFLDGEVGAIDDLREAVVGLDHQSDRIHFSYGLSTLARACLVVDDVESGLEAARRGIAWGTDTGQRYLEPLLRRVEGELLVLRGDRTDGERSIRAAIELARTQGAGLLELQANASLATCLADS